MSEMLKPLASNPLIDFLPYQRKWLLDDSRFKIGMFARQTGKTLVNAAEIIRDSLEAELSGVKTRWIILSRGERQSLEMMENYLKPLLQAFLALIALKDEAHAKDFAKRTMFSKNELRLPLGTRITALPANEDAARGFSGNLYLDEFAFHHHDKKIWQALYPIISSPPFKLRITSTPAGKNNKFYQLMSEQAEQEGQNSLWSRHRVDIYEAVKQGLPRDIAMLRQAAGDELLWRQEYELDWLDDKHAWLGYDLIMACEDAQADDKFLQQGESYIGVDIAHKQDLYVIAVIENVGDILWCRAIYSKKNISFAEQEALLKQYITQYQPLRIIMDATGMGAMPAERAKSTYGNLVEPIHFTAARKLHMASRMKYHFEQRTIRIPEDSALRQDLHSPQLSYSASGTALLHASHSLNGHADRFWALAMAVDAAHAQPFHIAYQGYNASSSS